MSGFKGYKGKQKIKAQQLYNQVVRHLFKQGKRAVGDNGNCLYRGPDCTSCAVGCLIADAEYDPAMEGQPLGLYWFSTWRSVVGRLEPYEVLLSKLQDAHDRPGNWDSEFRLKLAMANVAREVRLDDSVLDEVSLPVKGE